MLALAERHGVALPTALFARLDRRLAEVRQRLGHEASTSHTQDAP